MAMAMEDRSLLNGNSNNGGVHTATRAMTGATSSAPIVCSGCGKLIADKYLLKALDVYWHEDCLKCGCCDCRLGEVGSTLYTRANLILCKRDYLRLFGTSGNCAACCKVIPAFEMVMRAKNNVYHLECFACQQCHQRFCVGDRFYLIDNKILCEYDYEERLIFANMSSNSASLAQIQRRVTDIQQQSGNGAIESNRGSSCHGSGQSMMEGSSSALVAGRQHLATSLQQPPRGGSTAQHTNRVSSTANKHDSPSDGSSSGYGSPDSALLSEER